MRAKRKKKGKIFIIGGLLLIAGALCLTIYNLLDEHQAEQSADAVVETIAPEIVEKNEAVLQKKSAAAQIPLEQQEVEVPDYILNPQIPMPEKTVDQNQYIGIVSIPTLELELPVISEWSYPRLKKAPCRFYGSVYSHDMVICAHNYKRHFGNIKNLKMGDPVLFADMDGNIFNYEVVEIEVLQPDQYEEMVNSGYDLTLYTCTLGGATRITVRCRQVDGYQPEG